MEQISGLVQMERNGIIICKRYNPLKNKTAEYKAHTLSVLSPASETQALPQNLKITIRN